MITFEELSQKYPIANVALYGACVVVPGAQFDPDWEVCLGDQGYRCRFTDLDKRPVVLVQRKNSGSQDERQVYAPQKKIEGEKNMQNKENRKKPRGKGCQKGPSWSPEEGVKLLRRMKELIGPIKTRARQLAPEFGRSAQGLIQKHKKLLRAQKAVSSQISKQPRKVEESTPALEGSKDPIEERVSRLEDVTDMLQKVVDDLQKALDDIMAELQNEITTGNPKVYQKLRKELANHKHAVSGEAMPPIEVPT